MASIPELGSFSIYLSPRRSVLPVRLCWPVESMPDQMASNGLSEGIYSPSWARAVTCRCTMHAASNAPYHSPPSPYWTSSSNEKNNSQKCCILVFCRLYQFLCFFMFDGGYEHWLEYPGGGGGGLLELAPAIGHLHLGSLLHRSGVACLLGVTQNC